MLYFLESIFPVKTLMKYLFRVIHIRNIDLRLLFQVLYPHPDDTPTRDKNIFWIAVAIIITLLAILLMKIT